MQKGGHNFLAASNADLIFLQETKCAELPAEIEALDAYPIKHLYKTEGDGKGGHGGVALLSKRAPLTIVTGLGGDADFDSSGRYIQVGEPSIMLEGFLLLLSLFTFFSASSPTATSSASMCRIVVADCRICRAARCGTD